MNKLERVKRKGYNKINSTLFKKKKQTNKWIIKVKYNI